MVRARNAADTHGRFFGSRCPALGSCSADKVTTLPAGSPCPILQQLLLALAVQVAHGVVQLLKCISSGGTAAGPRGLVSLNTLSQVGHAYLLSLGGRVQQKLEVAFIRWSMACAVLWTWQAAWPLAAPMALAVAGRRHNFMPLAFCQASILGARSEFTAFQASQAWLPAPCTPAPIPCRSMGSPSTSSRG